MYKEGEIVESATDWSSTARKAGTHYIGSGGRHSSYLKAMPHFVSPKEFLSGSTRQGAQPRGVV